MEKIRIIMTCTVADDTAVTDFIGDIIHISYQHGIPNIEKIERVEEK